MLIPAVCSHSWPSVSSSVFPGARAGYIKTSFVPQLGAIGPVSLLLAGHSCDEAGQWNSVGFHEAERQGWLQTHAQGGVGWEPGTRAQSLYLTAKATTCRCPWPNQRPLGKAQSFQCGLCRVSGEGHLKLVFLKHKRRPTAAPPGSWGPQPNHSATCQHLQPSSKAACVCPVQ